MSLFESILQMYKINKPFIKLILPKEKHKENYQN